MRETDLKRFRDAAENKQEEIYSWKLHRESDWPTNLLRFSRVIIDYFYFLGTKSDTLSHNDI